MLVRGVCEINCNEPQAKPHQQSPRNVSSSFHLVIDSQRQLPLGLVDWKSQGLASVGMMVA